MVKNFYYHQPTRIILGMGKGAKLAKKEVNKEPIEKTLPIIGVPTAVEMGTYASGFFCINKYKRKTHLDLSWFQIKSNIVGLDEYLRWCEKADVEPMFTINLGTKIVKK